MNTRKYVISQEGKDNLVEISDLDEESDFKMKVSQPVKDKIILQIGNKAYEFRINEITELDSIQKSQAEIKEVKKGEFAIKAPMRGTITKILVKTGDKLKKSDTVVLLEAMKMENRIESPSDGEVKKIVTSVGAKVAPGEPLVIVG